MGLIQGLAFWSVLFKVDSYLDIALYTKIGVLSSIRQILESKKEEFTSPPTAVNIKGYVLSLPCLGFSLLQ